MRIVLTRPTEFNKLLARQLLSIDIFCIQEPVIEICPIAIDTSQLKQFNPIDVIIFTSRYAVEYAIPHLQYLLKETHRFAIGEATADRLLAHGFSAKYPTLQTSEGLLQLIQTEIDISKQQNILIVKGEKGRAYLKNQLDHFCKHVHYLNVYKRQKIPSFSYENIKKWKKIKIDTILAMNIEVFDLIYNLVSECSKMKAWLSSCLWLVPVERIASHLRRYGMLRIHILQGTNMPTIIDNIKQLRKEYGK